MVRSNLKTHAAHACYCMKISKKHLSDFSWSARRGADAPHWCWWGGWRRSVLLISPHHPLPPLPHPYSPLPSSVPASRLTLLARLSRLVAFTETAPKRRLGRGRTRRRAHANLCLRDSGWHKSSQRCPFVKESNYFGTFQPPPYRARCVSLSTFFSPLSHLLKTCIYSSDKSYWMKENANQTL